MAKIKDIVQKMKMNGTEYKDLSLLIAKRVWLIIASTYYLAFLFTVGGFYFGPFTLDILSLLTFHLYSILVVATAWFFYTLCEYGISIYFPTRKWLFVLPLCMSLGFATICLLAHLNII